MVRTSPQAELADVLTVQRNCLSADLVQFITSQNNLCPINSRREDSELGLRSHLQTGGSRSGRASSGGGIPRSLRNDEGRASRGRDGCEALDRRGYDGKEDGEKLVGLHDDFCYENVMYERVGDFHCQPRTRIC